MDSIRGLTKLIYDATVGKKSPTDSSTTTPSIVSSAATGGGDFVTISPNSTLDYIKSQAANLKSSLPGIISNALLQPVSDEVNAQNPLNALVSQFVNPAQSLLNSGNLTTDQLKTLQQEVSGLKNYLPALLSNSLLVPLQDTGNPVDSIVQSLSNQLSDLANQVQQKIQA